MTLEHQEGKRQRSQRTEVGFHAGTRASTLTRPVRQIRRTMDPPTASATDQ